MSASDEDCARFRAIVDVHSSRYLELFWGRKVVQGFPPTVWCSLVQSTRPHEQEHENENSLLWPETIDGTMSKHYNHARALTPGAYEVHRQVYSVPAGAAMSLRGFLSEHPQTRTCMDVRCSEF